MQRVELTPRSEYDPDAWYFDIPVIAELREVGFNVESPVTVIVGENGSGKSTLVEAIAAAWQWDFHGAQDRLWGAVGGSEDTDLPRHLTCIGARPKPLGGCFLRAESMHATFATADAARSRDDDQAFNELSHGQSFLRYVAERPVGVGLWILDEPEAALSFQSCLALLAVFNDLVAEGSQVIMATHSPLLAAFPGADIIELTDSGSEPREWAELDLVRNWRAFLAEPDRYLRYL
ncbi:AAA family ATPase [Antrihabitans sp. YC2-6]|uniref:AAA family ATPase n=1 Tax=Antrihabitans sp. YC2-6 TaxID=2799498 RepID=UPI0018F68734|nr:AAA family ATPase [Antrihabitans sp. YC2-6]MBJ8343589.1 AAA family ATPase [Antrihabitans sp. YC2-6]